MKNKKNKKKDETKFIYQEGIQSESQWIYIYYIVLEKREHIGIYIFISSSEYSRINDYTCDIGRWSKKRLIF